jgi:hypothetical protein
MSVRRAQETHMIKRFLGGLAALLLLASTAQAASVLYYRDASIAADAMGAALNASAHAVTRADSQSDFRGLVQNGGWDLVVYFQQSYSAGTGADTAIAQWVAGGGRAIFADWDRTAAIASLFGASYTGTNNQTQLSFDLLGNATLSNPGWDVFSMGLSAHVDATATAWFANGQDAVVFGNGGRTVLNGFLNDTLPLEFGIALFSSQVEQVLAAPVQPPLEVPEPASAVLLSVGLAGLALLRRLRMAPRTLVLAALVAGSGPAMSGVVLHSLRVTHYHEQTSDAGPIATGAGFDAQVRTTGAGDASQVSFSGSALGTQQLFQNANEWRYYRSGYGSLYALEADFPLSHGYSMQVSGGTDYATPLTLEVQMPGILPAAPVLTGNTYSALQQWDPTAGDFLMTFNGFDDLGLQDPNYARIYLAFFDLTQPGNPAIYLAFDNATTSVLLDGDLFAAGHDYAGALEHFYEHTNGQHPNFGSTLSSRTDFRFTAAASDGTPGDPQNEVPEPASLGLVALGVYAMWTTRRTRGRRK